MKNIFIIGSKGIPANYGGFETFVDESIPRKVWVPMSVEEDDIADWLSDKYGYCVESFTLEDEE